MTFGIIATIVLILINGFFVAAEFALVKVRSTQVDIKVKEGSKSALHIQHIQKHLDKYLSAMQLGITLASLGLGWVGEETMTHLILSLMHALSLPISMATAQSLSVPIAFIVITMCHIIIGEQLPKYMAIGNPLTTSLKVGRLLRGFYRIFSPFIWLLHFISEKVAHLVGVETNVEEDAHNEEELRMMLVESEEEGYINSSSHELIQNVFSFDDRDVRHIYTPKRDMSAIDITRTIDTILTHMIHEGYSRYPVYEKSLDNVIGVVTMKEVFKQSMLGEVTQKSLRSIMRPYHIVALTQSIESLLQDMQTMHTHIALVQNEFGEIIGMVTMEDIIEELIGDVQDEGDQEIQPYTVLEDGTWSVHGQAAISELNEMLPEALPEEDSYTTLGGYLIQLRGKIPAKGEELEDDTYLYRIESMRKHTIQTVHMALKNN